MRIRNFGVISILCLLISSPSARSQFTYQPTVPQPIREHNIVWVVTEKGVNATGTAFTDPELEQINDACSRLESALTSMRDLKGSAKEALEALQLVRDRMKQTQVKGRPPDNASGFTPRPMFDKRFPSYSIEKDLPKPVGVIQVNVTSLTQSLGQNLGKQMANIRFNLSAFDDDAWEPVYKDIHLKIARPDLLPQYYAQSIFWLAMNEDEQWNMLKEEITAEKSAYEEEWQRLLAEHKAELASSAKQ